MRKPRPPGFIPLGTGQAQHAKKTRLEPPGAMFGAGMDSELEVILANRLEHAGLPMGITQHRFVPGRLYRFDRAWPERMVAVEVQGGTWSQKGHARPSMIQRDCLKLSIAAALGWRVLPLTREMIESGQAVELIRQALEV